MEKTIGNLLERLNLSGTKNTQTGFFSIKGGASLSQELGNNAACTNSGNTCSGTNNGDCTNAYGTDCSKATNKAQRSVCSNVSCNP